MSGATWEGSSEMAARRRKASVFMTRGFYRTERLRPSRPQRALELCRRHRTAVQESLHHFAILAPQKRELRFRLHTLGHHAKIQRARHRDHGGGDGAAVRAVRQLAPEVLDDSVRAVREAL